MDGRGGCCIARYAPGGGGGGGGGGGPYGMSKVDSIMLRFRPIAPKPACGGSSSGGSSPDSKDTRVRPGRGRRRQVRGRGNATTKRSSRKRRACSKEKVGDASPPVEKVTLPLLPEMPEHKVGGDLRRVEGGSRQAADYYSCAMDPGFSGDSDKGQTQNVPKWLTFDVNTPKPANGGPFLLQPLGGPSPSPCVTVERVTETWVDGEALGRTDEERRWNLGRDTCPGFMSDGLGRVTWTNGALRKMVGREEEEEEEGGCGVWLAVREEARGMMWGAFTCRVRMEYTCGSERRAVTLPCDVWRMDGGGFAWRLDVEAALRLGR